MMRWIALALLLAGCNGNTTITPYPGRLDPIAGQWTTYGTGTGTVGRLTNPFTFHSKPSSINYVYTSYPNTLGGVITLNYSVEGDGVLGVADPADDPPPTLAMFIWRNNDDGTEFGRWWCPLRPELKLGDNQTYSCALYAGWTDVQGKQNQQELSAALVNPFAVGFTFGGQSFAGHGVWTTAGTATFKVNSFIIQ